MLGPVAAVEARLRQWDDPLNVQQQPFRHLVRGELQDRVLTAGVLQKVRPGSTWAKQCGEVAAGLR